MKLNDTNTDATILAELGRRLARRRLELDLTQAQLADEAGVSKRTVERIEAGSSAQLASFIRLLRVLGLVPGLDLLVPDDAIRPMELLGRRGSKRRRARTKREPKESTWTWGDDG